MTSTVTETARKTALHEAGHALLARHYGHRVHSVTLYDAERGGVEHEAPDEKWSLAKLEQALVIKVAGPLAWPVYANLAWQNIPAESLLAVEDTWNARTDVLAEGFKPLRSRDDFIDVAAIFLNGDRDAAWDWFDRAIVDAKTTAAGILDRSRAELDHLADRLLATGSITNY